MGVPPFMETSIYNHNDKGLKLTIRCCTNVIQNPDDKGLVNVLMENHPNMGYVFFLTDTNNTALYLCMDVVVVIIMSTY